MVERFYSKPYMPIASTNLRSHSSHNLFVLQTCIVNRRYFKITPDMRTPIGHVKIIREVPSSVLDRFHFKPHTFLTDLH